MKWGDLMKKDIYSWGNADYAQTIRMDEENEIFEIETIYSPRLGIDRKLTFVDRYMVEAMNKALKKKVEESEKGSAQEDRQAV